MNVHSRDLPATAGAYDRTYNGGQDAYVAKLSPDGDTNSADFPTTPPAIQRKLAGESDAFVLRLVPRRIDQRPVPPDAR